VVPQAKTVAYLKPGPQHSAGATEQMTSDALAAAHALGREIIVLKADSDRDFEAVFATLVDRQVRALVIGASVFFDNHDDKLGPLALRYAMPAIYSRREFTAAGGLMSYDGSRPEAVHQAGLYVGRILKGAKPAELPFQQSTKFE